MNKLQIYKASAGSGKTFNLSLYYLKTAFEGKNPEYFKKILAVTFTNKAAEEMKNRILEKLNDLIENGKKADFFDEIKKTTKLQNEEQIKKQAEKIRNSILHDYTLFSVSTIDSFVQKTVRAFSFEMHLNSSYDIELDTDKVIEELTLKLYGNISENKELQKWLLQFALSKSEDGKNWDFKNEIKQLATELFKEHFEEEYYDKNKIIEKKELNEYLKKLYKIKNNFEKEMSGFAGKYKSVLENAKLNHQNLGNKFKNISSHFFKKIKEKKYDDFTKALLESRNGTENWYKKNETNEIIEKILSVYNPLSKIIEDFFIFFEKEAENYYTATTIIKNFHSFGILNDMAKLLPEYRTENNILLISDTTLLLKKIIGNNDAPFIYEKTGNRYNHILIDEFQDTSKFQWQNFKPLIINSLSQGYGNLIVGDIKQSVYRWRGGDWKLLHSGVINDIGKIYIENKTLKTNWRSKENIIKFNNTVFSLMPEILQNIYNNFLNSISDQSIKNELIQKGYDKIITDVYKDQKQEIPQKKNISGGNIKLVFLENKNYNEKINEILPETVENLIKQKNKKPARIAILVRTNKQAKEITELLTLYQNSSPEKTKYKIISGESLYIEHSAAVKIIISAMKYIISPDNQINTAILIKELSELNNKTNLNPIFNSIKNNDHIKYLPEKFTNNINKLIKLNLFELTENLISIFNLYDKKQEFAYIKTFQNTVNEFVKNKLSDLQDFLEFWNEKGRKTSLTVSDKTNAVKILTIHKAKGLSFDTVIIPFSDFSFFPSGKAGSILWVKPEKAPFNNIKSIPVQYSATLAKTIFKKNYLNEMLYSFTDALNLIYVAFTRAENELICFAEYKEKNKEVKNIASALFDIMNKNPETLNKEPAQTINLNKFYDKENKIFEISEPFKHQEKTKNDNEKNFRYPDNKYPNRKQKNKINIKLNSENFLSISKPEIVKKINYGNLMHEIFKNIKTIKDVEKAVKQKYYEGIINKKETRELTQKIKQIISNEKVKQWFEKPYKIINEEELLTATGETKIPDRVLITDKELIVIDFKFGEYRKKYETQLKEYKKILKEIYKPEKIKAYIFFPDKNKTKEII